MKDVRHLDLIELPCGTKLSGRVSPSVLRGLTPVLHIGVEDPQARISVGTRCPTCGGPVDIGRRGLEINVEASSLPLVIEWLGKAMMEMTDGKAGKGSV